MKYEDDADESPVAAKEEDPEPQRNNGPTPTPAQDAPAEPPCKKLRGAIQERPDISRKWIRFLVGDSSKPFMVEEGLVIARSDYVKREVSNCISNDGEKIVFVRYPHDPEEFHNYCVWLDRGQIFYTGSDGTPVYKDEEAIGWRRAFNLAIYLEDVDYQDALIDAIIDRMIEANQYSSILPSMLYILTKEGSYHRHLALDLVIFVFDRESKGWRLALKKNGSQDLLFDLCINMHKMLGKEEQRRTARDYFDMDRTCNYHEHQRLGRPCYKTRPPYYTP